MLDRASLIIRGRGEQTKKRQQVDMLLKKAMKGNKQAKLKLYREFGVRVYSSDEVEKYVQQRVSQEYVSDGKSTNNGPTLLTLKKTAKGQSQNGTEGSRTSRMKSREKIKQLVKRI